MVDDFLEHHGIKGMKWGIRNGPPYPLNSSKPSVYNIEKLGSSPKKIFCM